MWRRLLCSGDAGARSPGGAARATRVRLFLAGLLAVTLLLAATGCGAGLKPQSGHPGVTTSASERAEEAEQKRAENDEAAKDREVLTALEAKEREEAAEDNASKKEKEATEKAKHREEAAEKQAKKKEKEAAEKIKKLEAAAKTKAAAEAKKKSEEASKTTAQAKQKSSAKTKTTTAPQATTKAPVPSVTKPSTGAGNRRKSGSPSATIE